jgi:hypothetical protein
MEKDDVERIPKKETREEEQDETKQLHKLPTEEKTDEFSIISLYREGIKKAINYFEKGQTRKAIQTLKNTIGED